MPPSPRAAPAAHVNALATAVPDNEVHGVFTRFATARLDGDPRKRAVFERMASRTGIERRYSTIRPAPDPGGPQVDVDGAFAIGAFPGTAARMDMFEAAAPDLAMRAVEGLGLGAEAARVTHLIVATCTGFSAPGLDLEILARAGLRGSVQRTMIGFMGCYAAVNALKLADQIVRADAGSRVLVVNCELCTLHLKETEDLETLLSFCLWGDGCSAALVTAEPHGLRLDGFHAVVAADARELMTWKVRDDGFDMVLSGRVPAAVQAALGAHAGPILGGAAPGEIDLWAVHPGGRSVLDAVERALDLPADALDRSRRVLRDHGNMSSATVMFVLRDMLEEAVPGRRGSGMAFGPGLTAETMLFETV